MIDNLADQLRRDEGVRLSPYVDTVGKVTIGVGRNLTDVGISNDEANDMLENDIRKAVASCNGLPWFNTMDYPRQAAILNMCFNLGFTGLLHFTHMLAALQKGDWETAAQEMLNSAWASQVGDRAKRLAEQIRTGVWQ